MKLEPERHEPVLAKLRDSLSDGDEYLDAVVEAEVRQPVRTSSPSVPTIVAGMAEGRGSASTLRRSLSNVFESSR